MTNANFRARTAFYPGSFDPLTNGHVEVIRHAAAVADRIVVAIGVHPGKATLFSADERAEMIREEMLDANGDVSLEVVTFDDLAVDAARRFGATL